jgi:hypothetical protein
MYNIDSKVHKNIIFIYLSALKFSPSILRVHNNVHFDKKDKT